MLRARRASVWTGLWTFCAALVAIGGVLASAQPAAGVCWADNFDGYPPATDLHGFDGWKGINNDPFFSGATSTFPDPANSPPQSVEIKLDTSLVNEICFPTESFYVFTAWQYIPSTFLSGGGGDPGSTFGLYNTYMDSGTQKLSTSIRADSNTGNLNILHGVGSVPIEVPYDTDKWVKIQTEVDLADDWTRVYYDDELITEYTWTGGITGGGGGMLDIAGVDLTANGSSPVYYDDLELEPMCGLTEKFDSYLNGSDLHGQGGWKGNDNNPAAGTPTTSDQSKSTPQSADVFGLADIVHESCTPDSGVYSFSAWQYIPSTFLSGGGGDPGSWFVLYDVYNDGGAKSEAVSIRADSNTGNIHVLHGVGSNSVAVPYDTDRWVKIQTIVDLDDDWTQIYYDDELVTEYTWTGGVLGDGGGSLDIAGVDFSAQQSSSIYYDDISLERGCGTTRTSDADKDGLSLESELRLEIDSCDADTDDDTVGDAEDNCPGTWNPQQEDCDYDGHGDACSPDLNMDGIADVCVDIVIPTLPSWGIVGLTLGLLAAVMLSLHSRRSSQPTL